jgi:hypothetical protein
MQVKDRQQTSHSVGELAQRQRNKTGPDRFLPQLCSPIGSFFPSVSEAIASRF